MTISFARHQFPRAIIRHAVWLYVRFTLSYRDVEDLLAERGQSWRRYLRQFGGLAKVDRIGGYAAKFSRSISIA